MKVISHHRSQLLFKSPLHVAQSIKATLKTKNSLTCSVGVAPNKLLAKLGSRMKKLMDWWIIEKENVERILKDLPVGKLSDRAELEKELNSIGIFYVHSWQSTLCRPWPRLRGHWRRLTKWTGLDDSPVIPSQEEDDPNPSATVHLEEEPLMSRR